VHGLLFFILFFSIILFIISGIATSTWKFDGSEYSWDLNKDGTVKEKVLAGRRFGEKVLKYSFITLIIASIVTVLIPNEKTAYTMVGAYAAQKVVENNKVQDMSGKVLTIINQKLDTYIDEGIQEAEKKAEKAIKGDKK
jgi:uncharacterized membrane-anchored protein YitT (DUF2179 family)